MKLNQPLLEKVITSSLNNKTLSHAYLLVGETDLLESAYWLSALVMSQSDDKESIDLMLNKLKEVEMVDFQFIDGSKGTIKKERISDLQVAFQNTALEATNQKVVLLHQIHQATPSALNALLKFLEEPSGQSTTFILTSESIQNVLPTILSRCILIRLQNNKGTELILDSQHPIIINHIKSVVSNQQEADELLEDSNYQQASNLSVDFINQLPINVNVGCVFLQLGINNQREVFSYVLSILLEHFSSLLYNKEGENPFTLKQLSGLILVMTQTKNFLNPSTNINLLVDEMCYRIQEVFNDN